MKKLNFRILTVLLSIAMLSQVIVYADSDDTVFVSAQAACLMEIDGRVIFEKNIDERLPMASTTKIMTALVAIESCRLDREVAVSEKAVGVEGSSVYLKIGEVLTMEELLYSLMLASANDAAAAIAYEIAGSIEAFAELMNEKARSMGLLDTHFTNPHGLDDAEHYTTARDLASLASYAMKNETFRKIASTERYTVCSDNGDGCRTLTNHNKLLNSYDGAIGVKTGFTKRCGRCLVSCAERDGVTLVAVTLNAPDDWKDHKALLDHGFDRYENVVLAEAGEMFTDIPCIGGDISRVRCSNKEAVSVVLPKGTKFATVIEADRYFPAPVKAGDALGSAVFYVEGEEIARLPLFAENDVELSSKKPSFFERILIFLGR